MSEFSLINLIATLALFLGAIAPIMILIIPRLGTQSKSPLSLLLDAVSYVVNVEWRELKKQIPKIDSVKQISLFVALAYLSLRKNAMEREQKNSEIQKKIDAFQRRRETDSSSHETSWIVAALMWILGLMVLAGLVFGVVAVVEIVKGFLQDPVGIAGECLAPALILILLFMLLQKYGDRLHQVTLQPVFIMGSGTFWQKLQADFEKNEAEEQMVIKMLEDSGSDKKAIADGIRTAKTEQESKRPDPDLDLAENSNVPVVPGITEFVLSTNKNAIDEIRKYLLNVRRLHQTVASVSFVTFIGTVLFALYAAVYLQSEITQVAFGGLTVGGVLGVFSYYSLRNARTSQIALALFTSFITELHVELAEAALEKSTKKRQEQRRDAWANFRVGLNSLWITEQKAKPDVPKNK